MSLLVCVLVDLLKFPVGFVTRAVIFEFTARCSLLGLEGCSEPLNRV